MNTLLPTQTHPEHLSDQESNFYLHENTQFAEPEPGTYPPDLNEQESMNISVNDTTGIQAALDSVQRNASSALLGPGDIEGAAHRGTDLLDRAGLTSEERVGVRYLFYSTVHYFGWEEQYTQVILTQMPDGWALTDVERISTREMLDDELLAGPHMPTAEELGKRHYKKACFKYWRGIRLGATEPIF